MSTFKKFLFFFLLAFMVVGVIGGFAVALTSGYTFIAVCILSVAILAVPGIVVTFQRLIGKTMSLIDYKNKVETAIKALQKKLENRDVTSDEAIFIKLILKLLK